MAGDAKKLQPIIIKRIKKGGHGAHGGAWKIAYADFVTAMMAFFLLMWLLGSTSEGDKKGIADFFSNPVKVSLLGGGTGSGDSSSVVRGGGTDLTRTNGQVKRGDIEAQRRNMNLQALKANQARAEAQRLDELKKTIQQAIDGNKKLAGLSSQLRLDMTRDGLRIQIVDDQNRPMFDSGSSVVKPYMGELLREIGQVLSEVPNKVTLEGHTDSAMFGAGERGYSNWELSSDRANASRRELISGGLPYERVLRVQGLASSVPFDKADPGAPTNRRISIIVMNRDAEDRFHNGSSDGAPSAEAEAPVPADATPATEPATEPAQAPAKQVSHESAREPAAARTAATTAATSPPTAATGKLASTAANPATDAAATARTEGQAQPAAATPLQAAVKQAAPPDPAQMAAQLAAADAAIRSAAPVALASPAARPAMPRIVSNAPMIN